jgi:hypothetical protein
MTTRSTLTAAAVALLAAAAAPATAQEDGPAPPLRRCRQIHSLPFTAAQPGRYCLAASLAFPRGDGAAAITVAADDVQIDLRGFTLDARGAGPDTRAIGIYAKNRRRVRVERGTLAGFRYGILLADAAARGQGHVIEFVTVLDSRAAGIAATGVGTLIRSCRVVGTRGRGRYGVGIAQSGSGAVVIGNTVADTSATRPGGYAAGIDLAHGFNRVVSGNLVAGVHGGALNYGLRCGAPFLPGNKVVGANPRASSCAPASGNPVAYPYPYPYPFHLETYPYPVAGHHAGSPARAGAPVLAGAVLAVLALLRHRRGASA